MKYQLVSVRLQKTVFGSRVGNKAFPSVCSRTQSHDSKHRSREAVTHFAPWDRAGESTDTQSHVAALSYPVSWKSTESGCLPAPRVDCLFPWPFLPEVKQLVRARHSGTWMESCPFHWQTHTEALLFCLFLFIMSCLPFLQALSIPHLFFRHTHRSFQPASYHVCWRNTSTAWSHIKCQPLEASCVSSRHQQFTDCFQSTPDLFQTSGLKAHVHSFLFSSRSSFFSFYSLFNK